MATFAKITSIFDTEDGNFSANVDVRSEEVGNFALRIKVVASHYREVPEQVQQRLQEFAKELAAATASPEPAG